MSSFILIAINEKGNCFLSCDKLWCLEWLRGNDPLERSGLIGPSWALRLSDHRSCSPPLWKDIHTLPWAEPSYQPWYGLQSFKSSSWCISVGLKTLTWLSELKLSLTDYNCHVGLNVEPDILTTPIGLIPVLLCFSTTITASKLNFTWRAAGGSF